MGQRPFIIGITGGIGAGKSTAVQEFVERGAVAFSADEAVHRLYGDPAVIAAVLGRWGDQVLTDDGVVDRVAIAGIVFHNEAERHWLEDLLHPLVAREWEAFIEAQRNSKRPTGILVAEVPLLFEVGLEDRYDATLLVTAPLDTRISRVGERAHAQLRAAQQMPEEMKAQRATMIIENTQDRVALAEAVSSIVRKIESGEITRAPDAPDFRQPDPPEVVPS